jgi:Tfp pilus assembly protein PilF
MRWISVLALLLFLTGVSRAAGPDDQYLDIYNEIIQADNLQQNGHGKEATAKYLEAQRALIELKATHPTWNTEVVSFRLEYLADQLKALAKAAPAPPPVAPVIPPPVAVPSASATEIAGLQEQIRSLTAANGALENKLKEALSVQPAAVSPLELAKAQERIVALQKEKDLLNVALEQAKAAKAPIAPSPEADKTAAQLADANQALANLRSRSADEAKTAQVEENQLTAALADAQKKITAAAVEIDALKAARASEASATTIAVERDKLKEELAARTRDLADAEAHRDQSVVELRAKLADMERQRDELRTKLAAVPVPAPSAADSQVDQLRARLAVLESPSVPYTPEELAVLRKNPVPVPIQVPTPPTETKHIVHSKKDLPPGTGAAMEEATRAKMQGDYPKATEIYQNILHQDENNVYVLAHLAYVQYAMNQLAECEKTVARALALDPDDAPSLYMLGVLRYQQKKWDEALNALSLSAKFNPTNADTQNYLGVVLSEKGLRSAAEAAFRKSVAADPKYADAHFNLAFVYAEEKPPSLELARWHYQRAVELGHGKSQELEKLLATSP